MNPAIGIDLGTTNTVIGVQASDHGPEILNVPQPVHRRYQFEEEDHIKSAVYFESQTSATVGAFAAHLPDTFRSIKSHMGTRWRTRHPYGGERISASFLSAHVLKLAYDTISRAFSEWDRTALITVPASFNTEQRADTIRAAMLAGFKKTNVKLLDEPTAAFYYYFDQYRPSLQTEFATGQTIMVFDFGGGTLDVSIIRVQCHDGAILIDPIGRSRYNNLGGDDIDLELASALLACWEQDSRQTLTCLSPQMQQSLCKLFVEKASAYKEECEDYMKEDLTLPEFVADEELVAGTERFPIKYSKQLTRSHYEEFTGRFFRENSGINIFRPIGEALAVANKISAGFTEKDLDLILYTGGASRMAGVRAALNGYFSPKRCLPISDEDACNTVAIGAAVCRYDEMHRSQEIRMRHRLLEAVFTRSNDHHRFVNLVPLDCEPSDEFSEVGTEFNILRPTVRLRQPLFRGVSSTDHQLAPLGTLEIPNLGRVVDAGSKYRISYRMTPDKTIEFKVRFQTAHGPLEHTASVEMRFEMDPNVDAARLCTVNSSRGSES